jgi:thiamine-monophosphate kinase
LKVSFVDGLYDGLSAAAKRFGVQIVGGDTNQSDRLVLSVALLGDAAKGKAVRRSGARKGDVVFVTGSLGGSYLSKRHLRFEPRIKESQFLARNFNLHSMIDLSDGLASDITRIAEESGVGARISREAIPVSKGVSVKSAISEGEDFELLFTLSAREAARLALHPKVRGLAPFHRIGRIVDKREGIRLVHANGRLEPLLASGFDHFSRHR